MAKKKKGKKSSGASKEAEVTKGVNSNNNAHPSVVAAAVAAKPNARMPVHERERRLNPIYDAIDAGNLKGASKLLTATLAKYPGDHMCLVLMALVYARSGHPKEAGEIIDQVREMVPVEEQVLSTLTLVLKQLDRVEESVVFYENALKVVPHAENIAISLYFACGRKPDFRRQQQVAMLLYKMSANPKFVFWSAISQLAQVKEVGKDSLLALSEMMIARNCKKDDTAQKMTPEGRFFSFLLQFFFFFFFSSFYFCCCFLCSFSYNNLLLLPLLRIPSVS